MRHETVQILKDEDFKRSTGVQRSTFEKMLEVVEESLRNFGRPPKLSRADQLLMTLMYWREYRTEFHIGLTYGVSEVYCVPHHQKGGRCTHPIEAISPARQESVAVQ